MIPSTMGYYDEYVESAKSWKDLNSKPAVIKGKGRSGDDDHFEPLELRNESYGMSASIGGETYNFECIPEEIHLSKCNAFGNLNTNNCASEIKRGTKKARANTANRD